MKTLKIMTGLFILCLLTASAANAQQQFVHTVTSQNKYCNSACSLMDVPALNNNPSAIILVTPILVNGATPNQHPVGVHYVDKKWSVVNTDSVTIADGAKFNIQYWATPGANQFVYIIPPVGTVPCLNHAALNGNSRAQFLFSPTTSPRGQYFNQGEMKIQYDSSTFKWCLANINGQPMSTQAAYNIVITSLGVNTTDLTPLPDQNPKTPKTPIGGGTTDPACNCPTSLPPNGNAGGDLSGTYPSPTVKQIMGRPISNAVPKVGQILKWSGTEWIPDEDHVADSGNTPIPPKPSVLTFIQIPFVDLNNPNVNTKPIPGLDNQTFTLDQNSRIVFQTVIDVQSSASNGGFQANATGIKLAVEILNTANAIVARSTSLGWVTKDTPQNFVAVGIGILPKGTYHTKVSIIRQEGGAELLVLERGVGPGASQGGQMIIQIFPD